MIVEDGIAMIVDCRPYNVSCVQLLKTAVKPIEN